MLNAYFFLPHISILFHLLVRVQDWLSNLRKLNSFNSHRFDLLIFNIHVHFYNKKRIIYFCTCLYEENMMMILKHFAICI